MDTLKRYEVELNQHTDACGMNACELKTNTLTYFHEVNCFFTLITP